MNKRAPAGHELHDLIATRWSPRAFSDKPVADGVIRSLLEAARWAASCFNAQPWRFIVAPAENAQEHARLLSCLVEQNQLWAKNAPLLMLSVAELNFERNGKPNPHAWHDVGQAAAQLTLQATASGLFVHQMAGYNADRARELYSIPEGFAPVAAFAIGYLGDADALPDPFREREAAKRSRKPQSALAFRGKWDEAF